MKIFLLVIAFLASLTSSYACDEGEIAFPQSNICAKIEWQNTPTFNQYTNAIVTLKNNQDYSLNVIPWMVMAQGHEHGSRPVKMTVISPSDYLVEKIYFMGGMKGDWFLRLQLLNGTNIVEEIRTKIQLN